MNPLVPLSSALNELGLAFVVVGSTASSARGTPRATMDIDLVVRIGALHAEPSIHFPSARATVEPNRN